MNNSIKKVDIVIGIPSYNEAKSISYVIHQIDKGIQKYFKGRKAVIINADNNSPDKTGKVFLALKTRTPKILISTNKKGKGINVYNILKKSKELNAKTIMIADADLKSIKPEWVKCLIGPVLNNYDFITPIYKRDEEDGSITKHICYPLIYGLLGYEIRQPIGGEFSFSRKFADYLLKQKWDANTYKFGIDIFISLNAIKGNFRIAEADLGIKRHKSSLPNLKPMFMEVVTEFFNLLIKNKRLWNKKVNIKKTCCVCRIKTLKRSYFRRSVSLETVKTQKRAIFYREWTEILYTAFYEYAKSGNKRKILKNLHPLFVDRMITYDRTTVKTNEKEDEKLIRQQAQYFYKTRAYSSKKLKVV